MHLALFVLGLAAALSSAASYEVYMTDLSPNGATVNWDISGRPEGVMGFEVTLECDAEEFTVTEAVEATGSNLPDSWMVQCSISTAKCLGFSLQGIRATQSGPILEYSWLPTLGNVDLSSFSAANHLSQQIDLDVQRPTPIPQPVLDVSWSTVKPSSITLASQLTGWDAVRKAEFSVIARYQDGSKAQITTFSALNGADVTCTAADTQLNCVGNNLPGELTDLVEFAVPASVYHLYVEKAPGMDSLEAAFQSVRKHTLTFDVQLENDGKVAVPKVGLGFKSVEAVEIYNSQNPLKTCGTSAEFCVQKEMEVVVGYQTYDSGISFSGFQFEIVGPVEWLRAELPPAVLALNGMTLSHNNKGTFVAFSISSAVSFPATNGILPLLNAYYTRTVEPLSLSITKAVMSDSLGVALGTIIYSAPVGSGAADPYAEDKTGLGGNLFVASCDGVDPVGSEKDGLCDDEDFDCDCCINNVDAFPEDANKGCGLCGDVNNNGIVDIMDALLDINMVVGIQSHDSQNGDATGDGAITVADIVRIVDHILAPELEVKSRPCNQVAE